MITIYTRPKGPAGIEWFELLAPPLFTIPFFVSVLSFTWALTLPVMVIAVVLVLNIRTFFRALRAQAAALQHIEGAVQKRTTVNMQWFGTRYFLQVQGQRLEVPLCLYEQVRESDVVAASYKHGTRRITTLSVASACQTC